MDRRAWPVYVTPEAVSSMSVAASLQFRSGAASSATESGDLPQVILQN